MGFDTSLFIKFVFSVFFLFVCALFLMLYTHKIAGFAVQTFLRYCVLPPSARVRLGGVFFAPLNCRLFIQNFFYQDENMSLRVVDGYISFIFWDTWWGDPSWTGVKEFMLTSDLKGMRCRVRIKKHWVSGVIVDILRDEKKLRVQFEPGNDDVLEENLSNVRGTDDNHSVDISLVRFPTLIGNPSPPAGEGNHSTYSFPQGMSQRQRSVPTVSVSFVKTDDMFSPQEANSYNEEREQANISGNGVNDNLTSLFDMSLVQLPRERGKFRVHLNGMGLCLYNATWNYKNLVSAEKKSNTEADSGVSDGSPTLQKWALRSIFNRLGQSNEAGLGEEDEDELRQMTNDPPNEQHNYSDEARAKAMKMQSRLKSTKSILQRFYDFIGAIEVEMFASYIDIGGAGAAHPYFLHIGFKRGECHNYITQKGVPSIDLYRFVSEMTMEELHACWCPMKKERESMKPLLEEEQKKTWRDSFRLMFEGTTANDMPAPVLDDVSSLIWNYGMLIGSKEKSTVHSVFYRDVTNVYAGEEISREGELPLMGLEVFIEAPEICYGPWSHYSLTKLKEFFFPVTYQPLESLKFELGKPRPLAGFEFFVEFLRETCVAVPFKRKSPAPSPPFGICDSGRKGVVFMSLGLGSQYVQKPQFLLHKEKKQRFEGFFEGKNVGLATNGIQDESNVFMQMRTMKLFVDREDDRAYNGRKLWNILFSLGEAEMWWYMEYVTFFRDLILDWQFVPEMYHGRPLTTENYNTYNRFVKEFIPNVKRFEVFFTDSAVLHLNSNPQNVIFSEDLNDELLNNFLSFHINGTSHFFMTLPSDTYLLSAYTEVQRPFELSLRDIDVFLSLSRTHPLYSLVDPKTSFAKIDEVSLKGSQTVYIPNQTVPQDKTPVDPLTGRTKHINHLDTDVQLVGLRGFAMAPHICALIDVFDNIFGVSCCVIRPDELFWPLSRGQPKLNLPNNVRQKFSDYLQKDEPACNIQEISFTLGIRAMDITLQTGEAHFSKLNLCCGSFNFSFLKQCEVNDLSMTISPITGRFFDQDGTVIVENSYLCCGSSTYSWIRHFGPMPLRTLFHAATDIMVNGITFNMTIEQVAMLTQLLDAFIKQFSLRDAKLLDEIENARTRAAYSAEDLLPRAARPRANSAGATFFADGSFSLGTRMRIDTLSLHEESCSSEGATDVRLALQRFLMRDGFVKPMPFLEAVPDVMAADFHEYLALFEKAADEARDYAVVTMLASIGGVRGLVRVGDDGYLELQLPQGVQLASSTLNDLNSNTRMSAAIREVALHGYCRLETQDESRPCEDFAEVFHVKTSLRVRHCTAYPFEKGLDQHLEKQRQFVATNDVEHLFLYMFPVTELTPLRRSSVSERERGEECNQGVYVSINKDQYVPDAQQEQEYKGESVFSELCPVGQTSSEAFYRNSDKSREDSGVLKSVSDVSAQQLTFFGTTNDNTSQRFVTCLSMVSSNDIGEEEEIDSDVSSWGDNLTNDVFISPHDSPNVPFLSQVDVTEDDTYMMRPPEFSKSFLRLFFLHSQPNEDDMTLLKYSASARCGKGGFQNFTSAHAPLPSASFFAALDPHRAPSFFIAERMLNSTSDDDNGEESELWALRQADNRKRSREGATSKHLHIEALAPLTGLVTKQFLEVLYIDAETRFFTQVRYCQIHRAVPSMSSTAHVNLGSGEANDKSCVGGHARQPQQQQQQQRKIRRKELSKNRAHQKRWLSEVKVVSVIFPCIEVKVLAEIPVPQDNIVPGAPDTGVYTTMLSVRSLQFVMQRTLPPAHSAIPIDKTVLSVSVMVSSLAIITQVEYEPLMRKGNLGVKVPGIAYDDGKDSIAVLYITSVCGRGKRDNTYGMGNGTCHVTVDTVAFHLTRDFFFYLHSIKAMLLQLHSMRHTLYEEDAFTASSTDPVVFPHKRVESFRDIVFPKFSELGEVHIPLRDHFGIDTNLIVQGVGSINTLRVELIDVFREGHCIHVHTENPNIMELKRPSAKFLTKIPIKQKGGSGTTHTVEMNSTPTPFVLQKDPSSGSQELPRRRMRRDTEVQFMGEVDSLLIRCYPSVFHILDGFSIKEVVEVKAKGGAQKLSQSVPALVVGLLRTPYADMNESGFDVIFKGSFTLHKLNVSMLHSEMNYLQFTGTNLAGCGESRTERISSRECVQTHVLIEAISDKVRSRLCGLAQRARLRAPKSRYAVPPSVTSQLHLKKTGTFFAESIILQYVADVILQDASGGVARSSEERAQGHEESRVFVATVTQIVVGIHQADQKDVVVDNGSHTDPLDGRIEGTPNGVQVNLQVDVGKVSLFTPYRPQAAATVQPQLHQWLQGWLESRKILRTMRATNLGKVGDGVFASYVPDKRIYAWCCAMEVHGVQVGVDLPQGIGAEMSIPLVSAFLNFSSDNRLSLKSHLHPSMLLLKSPSAGRHAVGLPNIYVIYYRDEIRSSGVCLMESVEFTVSPSIISHLLLIFERLITVYKALSKPFCMKKRNMGNEETGYRQQMPSPNLSQWKGRFVFLLGGLCVSYLTSITNLRLSIRKLNALADMLSWDKYRTSRVLANVFNAQIALLDRDDYDQLHTTLRKSAMPVPSDVSVPSTKAALFYKQSMSLDSADSARAIRHLGGFIWGLFETSFTLSSGRNDTNELRAELTNICASLPGSVVDLSEVDKLSSVAARWDLSIISPLIIARVGLVPLLQRSIDETKDIAKKLRFASQREGRLIRRRLFKHAAYRQLMRVKMQMVAEMKRSQHDNMRRLSELTAQVVPKGGATAQRRSSFLQQSKTTVDTTEKEDLFSVTSNNKFFATVSDFLVVVPFGDAAYRSIVEGQPDVFLPGRGMSTLNRRRFIPTMALKLRVEKTTFVCNLVHSEKWVPMIQSTAVGEIPGLFIASPEQNSSSRMTCTARFAMDDVHLYCSDGSPMDSQVSAKDLLGSTHILGGLGILTSLQTDEYRQSFSKVSISYVEIPFHVNKSGNNVSVGAVMDISAPCIAISTRFFSILSQITQEITSVPFAQFTHCYSPPRVVNDSEPSSLRSTLSQLPLPTTRTTAKPSNSGQRKHVDPMSLPDAVQVMKESSNLYSFDVTGRIERGMVRIYSLKKEGGVEGFGGSKKKDTLMGQVGWSQRRRVKFSTGSADGNNASSSVGAAHTAATGCLMTELVTFPTPDITVMAVASFGEAINDEEFVVRVELRGSTIEIGPSIMSLAQEIEDWVTVHDRDNNERTARLLSLVSDWERDPTNSCFAFYSSLADLALPVPRAFAMALEHLRPTPMSSSGIRRQKQLQQPSQRNEEGTQSQTSIPDDQDSVDIVSVRHGGRRKSRFTSVHIRFTGLHVMLTTEPVSTVTLSLFLDERGGSIEFFVKQNLGGLLPWRHQPDKFFSPSILFFICVRRLRLECQAKLEVKSLEMYLPEAEVCVALRRHQKVWELTCVYFHTPPDPVDDAFLDITVRAPHVSQLFIVQELWHNTLLESLQRIGPMFGRNAFFNRGNRKKTDAFQRPMHTTQQNGCVDETLVFVVTSSHVKMRLDLGSGNAHNVSLGGVYIVLQRLHPATRVCRKMRFDVMVRSFTVRSEGVLSGMANLDSVFLKGFLIENADGVMSLTRSPAGRTFRDVLCVQKLYVKFKERQLKDVFECQVTEFCIGSMDGVGEDNEMIVRADMSLYRSSIAVTPSTVPAFINTIKSFSEIVSVQRAASVSKLQEGGVHSVYISMSENLGEGYHDMKGKGTQPNQAEANKASLLLPPDANAVNYNNYNFSDKNGSDFQIKDFISFMGNRLTRIPSGEIQVRLEQTTLLLGSDIGGVNNSGYLIASFPRAILDFAECLGEEHTIVKKVLEIDTENVEIFRPGAVKVLILGFRGINKFEFYSRQEVGENEVGFVLNLHQSNPWTGNPRFQDFQEMIQLVRSFTEKSNVEVIHRFGQMNQEWRGESKETTSSVNSDLSVTKKEDKRGNNIDISYGDERLLKPLRHVKFSPQLRFGGDVAVNIDVILNWLGISETMLPYIFHVQACDRLEGLLNRLARRTREYSFSSFLSLYTYTEKINK